MKQTKRTETVWVDPPSGWRYGFPKPYVAQVGETFREWLVKQGYPQDSVELAVKYTRMWVSE